MSGGPRSSTHQGNVKGERDRWARILDHWDDRLHEHDIDEKPFPVDDPIVPANQ